MTETRRASQALPPPSPRSECSAETPSSSGDDDDPAPANNYNNNNDRHAAAGGGRGGSKDKHADFEDKQPDIEHSIITEQTINVESPPPPLPPPLTVGVSDITALTKPPPPTTIGVSDVTALTKSSSPLPASTGVWRAMLMAAMRGKSPDLDDEGEGGSKVSDGRGDTAMAPTTEEQAPLRGSVDEVPEDGEKTVVKEGDKVRDKVGDEKVGDKVGDKKVGDKKVGDEKVGDEKVGDKDRGAAAEVSCSSSNSEPTNALPLSGNRSPTSPGEEEGNEEGVVVLGEGSGGEEERVSGGERGRAAATTIGARVGNTSGGRAAGEKSATDKGGSNKERRDRAGKTRSGIPSSRGGSSSSARTGREPASKKGGRNNDVGTHSDVVITSSSSRAQDDAAVDQQRLLQHPHSPDLSKQQTDDSLATGTDATSGAHFRKYSPDDVGGTGRRDQSNVLLHSKEDDSGAKGGQDPESSTPGLLWNSVGHHAGLSAEELESALEKLTEEEAEAILRERGMLDDQGTLFPPPNP